MVRLVTYCDKLMSEAFSKNEQLLELAKKTNDPASTSADLEKWLHETTVNNDEILKKHRRKSSVVKALREFTKNYHRHD